MKITKATITAMPVQLFDPMPEILIELEDGSSDSLGSFYPDEISVDPVEIVGLTVAEAKELIRQKDIKYIQS